MSGHNFIHRRQRRAAFPEPEPQNRAAGPQTLVSIVYVTASPTFTGAIGGYSTVGVPGVAATKSQNVAPAAIETDHAQTSSQVAFTQPLPTVISSPTIALGTTKGLLAATSSEQPTKASSTTQVVAPTNTSTNAPAASSGMSAGGKAGMAIGILLLVGAALSLVLFCFKKRRDVEKRRLADQEKDNPFGDAMAMTSNTNSNSATRAPRLSLRPVTQFLPNLAGDRRSRGNALMMSAPKAGMPTVTEKMRPITPQSDRNNPFGNHAEAIDPTNANGPAVVHLQGLAPEQAQRSTHGTESAIAAATAGAAIGLARGASKRENAPKPLDFTRNGPFQGPPSPARTEFSVNSESNASPMQTKTGAAIAAAGGPPNSAVHRVQLDFKPSMDDELALRAGQLVRLLHEYDDGWALCIRLDRSEQGVCPRTCLSTRPVKPRPQNGSKVGPRGPPPPAGGPKVQGPPYPTQQRPMTPNGQQQRPMTPNGQQQQQRPMTPNGQNRSAPSQSQGTPRNSPPGQFRLPVNPQPLPNTSQPDMASSPPDHLRLAPARKPVPGQAL